ncbi:MAG: tetratricopeptide repeat protein, partial [Planctomycetota bacterium]
DSGPDADRRPPPSDAEGRIHDGKGPHDEPGNDPHHGDYDDHDDHHYYDHHHATKQFIFISFFGTTHGFLSCFKTWYPGFYDYCYGYVSSWWPSWCSFDYGYYPWATPSYYVGSYPEPYPVTVYLPPPACPYTQGEAWGRLAAGDLETAAMAFECLSQALPDDGLPATGHALALALMGERAEAVPILRSALAVDPEALEFVPMDDALARSLRELAGLYEYQARRNYGDLDALFMAGAVRYLLGDFAAARYALQAATTLGDTDDGALNLQALIELAMER